MPQLLLLRAARAWQQESVVRGSERSRSLAAEARGRLPGLALRGALAHLFLFLLGQRIPKPEHLLHIGGGPKGG